MRIKKWVRHWAVKPADCVAHGRQHMARGLVIADVAGDKNNRASFSGCGVQGGETRTLRDGL